MITKLIKKSHISSYRDTIKIRINPITAVNLMNIDLYFMIRLIMKLRNKNLAISSVAQLVDLLMTIMLVMAILLLV